MKELTAQNLRVGNYIQLNQKWFERNPNLSNTPKINIVKDISFDIALGEHAINSYSMCYLKPIPLTEQWLIDFGFEKINHIGGYSFYSIIRNGKNKKDIPNINIYESYTTIGNNSMCKHLEYVHQLQNLFFCLTGKELTK